MKLTGTNTSEKNALKKLLLVLGLSVLVFGLFLRLFMNFNGVDERYKISLNHLLKGEITHGDGSVESFTGNTFPAAHLGDTIVITLDSLPENPYSIGASLCFFVSNSYTEVYSGKDLLYAQDKQLIENHIYPGNSYHVISLPPDYANKTVTITITPVDRTSFTSLSMWLSPDGHSIKNILVDKESAFVLLIAMAVVSGFVVILMTVLSFARKKFSPMIFLSCFCFLIIAWNLGSQGFFYVFSDSLLASQGEYMALYMACIPLSCYMTCTIQNRILKRIMEGFAVFFTGFFLVMTIINFSSVPSGYNTVLMVLHMAILAMMLVYFISCYADRKCHRPFADQIARVGFGICIAIGMTEFIRFNLVNNFGTHFYILRKSLGPVAIAELVLTMILSVGYSYASDLIETMEKEQLRRLAFQDNLTQIPNRSACYLGLDTLAKEKKFDYTMLFMDLNFLKKANDTYGHEVGDRMLILTAEAMKAAFENNGFYGRWGGDEFIACVPGDEKRGARILKQFKAEVKRINETEKDLPYGLSIAVGRCLSTSQNPINPMDAVNQADDQMYLDKKQMKAERSE